MSGPIKHYRLVLELAGEPTGMQTASCRVCMACRGILTSSGGGGEYICQTCLEALWRGPFRHNFRALRDASAEDLAILVELLPKKGVPE